VKKSPNGKKAFEAKIFKAEHGNVDHKKTEGLFNLREAKKENQAYNFSSSDIVEKT
jgi:hypothetical protein